ncbi:HdeD family acid-resistance protein [Lentzea sp. NPDC059081]|uniref:HdeD family acid-resistance protein n=1 Tax=Lentzea sp. NPDC059081 TaxID=3346719 RepID=UPI0036CCFF42
MQRWWLFTVRGVFAVLFGVAALVWPGLTLIALIILWGAYVFFDGAMMLYLTFAHQEWPARWALGLVGVLGLVTGLVALFWPGITASALLLLIAVWALVAGVLQIVDAIRLRKVMRNEWFYVVTGVLTVLLGVILVLNPAAGALAFVITIGAFAILWGVVLVLFSLRLKRLDGGLARPAHRV